VAVRIEQVWGRNIKSNIPKRRTLGKFTIGEVGAEEKAVDFT